VVGVRKIGHQITADPREIQAATSEAAYFMFAARKEHRPRREPLKLPERGHWLDRKPVFAANAEREKIRPLFDKLIEQMGYDEARIYEADVRYGVSNHARFALYRFGYSRDNARREGRPELLLGDAEYVIKLP